jgi:hypothetical protein
MNSGTAGSDTASTGGIIGQPPPGERHEHICHVNTIRTLALWK